MRNPSFTPEKEMQLLQQAPHYSVRELALQFGLTEQVIRNICTRNKIEFKGKRIYRHHEPRPEPIRHDAYRKEPPEPKKKIERVKGEYSNIPSPYGIATELLFSK